MSNTKTIILLVLVAIVGVFTLDVYLPGIPAMAKQFDVTLAEVTYTFTAFSVIFALCQLVHGSLSDVIGRKPVLLAGLSIAAVSTVLCIQANSYNSILMARILQAVGISAFVVVNAIIRDLYTGARAVQVRTLVAMTSGISISIAPTIGGLLQEQLSWQGGFIASLVLIVLTLAYATLFYQESNTNKGSVSLKFSELSASYLALFKNSDYLSHVVLAMLAFTVHFSFIILSASVFVEVLGKTPLVFGYLMFIYGLVYFLSGLFSTWLANKLPISMLINIGGGCIGIGGLLMLLLVLSLEPDTIQVLLPMAVMTLGVTMARAAAITGALAPIPKQAGQGAAGLNLVQFALSALIATALSKYGSNPLLSMSVLAISSASAMIFLIKRVDK